ncbi:hypothetical protein FHW12_001618 [Dokdonella fugitiva]|uniref:Uncharacterized protein n=1 Tax=Dokdonella fugitiva TaxID=328517 RepID=A0A839F569_9GAMM|nr:hypothetical protein [Dokdonella fugitiva]MBA8887404.1 hypothetical protein [Dokdonella fugitiva]
MSDPSLHTRTAQAINFGLLAARSSDAIARAGSQALSLEDQAILGKAADFLHQAAQGAEFIASGTQSGGSAFASTEALGYALRPVESLDAVLRGRQAPLVFSELETAVREIAAGHSASVDVNTLNAVRLFFDRLYTSLLGMIEHNRLRPSRHDLKVGLGYHA